MNQRNIAEETEDFLLENMAGFYNENVDYFKGFEKELGVDIWFLEHFRMHFKLRNQKLNTKGRDVAGKSKYLIGRATFYQEFSTIIRAGWTKHRGKPKNILLVNSRFVDEAGGFKFNTEETKDWSIMMNRQLLTVMDGGFRQTWKSTLNTDAIMLRYILSFRWVFDGPLFYFKLQKLLNRLRTKSNFSHLILSELRNAAASFMLYWLRFKSMEMFF